MFKKFDTGNSNSNTISNLPRLTSYLFPSEYELLPNTSELFELEFAFYGVFKSCQLI